jgi:hypothetical protein
MSNRIPRWALLAATALALSACGTEQPGTDTAAPAAPAQKEAQGAPAPDGGAKNGEDAGQAGDPCALLTPAQAKKALKADKIGPAEVISGQCIYAALPPTLLQNIGVGRNDKAGNEAELRALLDQSKSSGYPAEAVNGIGDAAYLVATANILHVMVDGTPYVVTGLTDRDGLVSAAKSLVGNVS